MSMESGKFFFKPDQVEAEKQEQEAIKLAKEEAEKAGKPFDVLDKEIIRLEAKREKVASTLKAKSDTPALEELDAQIKRLKDAKDRGWHKEEK